MRFPIFRLSLLAAIAAALTLVGCSTTDKNKQEKEIEEPTSSDSRMSIDDFSSINQISSKDWEAGLHAFQISCKTIGKKTLWKEVCTQASTISGAEAKNFFRTQFTPWKITKIKIGTQTGTVYSEEESGLMTGYYEPLLKINREKTAAHQTPILSTPSDLIIVDLASLYPALKGLRLRGKIQGRKLIPYDDRKHIVNRTDLDKYAIGWSDDPVAVFFLQIQGSGRLETNDGETIRVGYDDQNGHPYKAVGSWLVQKGYLKRHELSMQNIQKWARENPSRVNELLDQNPSFVFFKERTVTDPEEGPVGAQGLPLTPQASVAVDRKHVPMGVPLIVHASQSNPPLEFTRPVVAQDTGGAIKGPLRFDYFWGFGDEAGKNAGRQKSDVSAWILLPKGAVPEALR